jgi:hypothetical protein
MRSGIRLGDAGTRQSDSARLRLDAPIGTNLT